MTTRYYEITADKPTQDALLQALARFCTCETNDAGARVTQCPGHAALIDRDNSWIGRLLFEHWQAARLNAEEWCQSEPVQAAEPVRTTPMTGMCSCGHWDSLHYGPFDSRAGCFAPGLWPESLQCRCSGFTAQNQPQPASDDLVWERYGNGFAWLRRAA